MSCRRRGLKRCLLVPPFLVLFWPRLVHGAGPRLTVSDDIAQLSVLFGVLLAGTLVFSRGSTTLKRRLTYVFILNFATFSALCLALPSYWAEIIEQELTSSNYGVSVTDLLCNAFYLVCWDLEAKDKLLLLGGQVAFAFCLTGFEYLVARVLATLRRSAHGWLRRGLGGR